MKLTFDPPVSSRKLPFGYVLGCLAYYEESNSYALTLQHPKLGTAMRGTGSTPEGALADAVAILEKRGF